MKNPTIQQLFDLSGKVALVTGGKHLGYDACEALADLGATVVLTRRSGKEAAQTAERLSQDKGIAAFGIPLEVTDPENWKEAVDGIVGQFGKIDILINNAGGRRVSQVPETSDEPSLSFVEGRLLDDWNYTLNSNLTSVFIGCKTVVPHMRQTGYGKIINMGSIDGVVGRDLRIYPNTGLSPTAPDYLASKAGVINLTRGLAVALAPHGIYVNCISPGGFFRNQPERFVANYEKLVPLGRMGRDGVDLKGAIAFLASAASDYIVGHNLVIDGGYTAW